jgi:hypothetical protein
MASPLENLTGPGKPLRREPPDAKEFSGLRRSALRGLARLTDIELGFILGAKNVGN